MSATLVSYMASMSKVMKGKKTSFLSSTRVSRRALIGVCSVVTVAALASSVGTKVSSLADTSLKVESKTNAVALRPSSQPFEVIQSDSEIIFSFLHDYVATDPFASREESREPSTVVHRRRRRPSQAVVALQESTNRFRKATRMRDRSKIPLQVKSDDFLVGLVAMLPAFQALGGPIHSAAVKDILGNVKKLRRNTDGGGRRPHDIRDDVLEDYLTSNNSHPDSSAQASVWLARILDFTHAFFTLLVDRPNASLTSCLFAAYEATLGKHHNVVMRGVAFALMQIIPNRAAMVRCFDLESFDQLQPILVQWNVAARPIVDRLYAFHQKANSSAADAALLVQAETTPSDKPPAAASAVQPQDFEFLSSLTSLHDKLRKLSAFAYTESDDARRRRRRRIDDDASLLQVVEEKPPTLTLPAPAL